MFEVVDGGLETTIQDLGRPRYQSSGITPSGAFDHYSFRLGNLLLGNRIGSPYLIGEQQADAGLEILYGLQLKVLKKCVISITGGELSPTLNGHPLPMWQAIQLAKNDVITFSYAKKGCRAYLTVAGGIDVPLFLGSRSTFVRGAVGGVKGRALKRGDIINTGQPKIPSHKLVGREIKSKFILQCGREWNIRVVLGPQDYLFTDESVKLFLRSLWKVSHRADRMGYRYEGPQLEFKPKPEYLMREAGSDPSNIVDDTIPIGAIQYCETEPVVLGVDGPSVGGYAKIANVISVDLPQVAQSRTWNKTRFLEVSVDEAVKELKKKEKIFQDAI